MKTYSDGYPFTLWTMAAGSDVYEIFDWWKAFHKSSLAEHIFDPHFIKNLYLDRQK